jgi:glycine/D-amino acid oxidase-like deaminating enzyme
MQDFVVVGAGLMGSQMARRLRENGFTVDLVDKPPAERNGPVLWGTECITGWMNPFKLPLDLQAAGWESLRLYKEQAALLGAQPGSVARVTGKDGKAVPQGRTPQWFCVNPTALLDGPTLYATAERVDGKTVRLTTGQTLTARHGVVVCAAGAGRKLGMGQPTSLSYGATAVWERGAHQEAPDAPLLRIHMVDDHRYVASVLRDGALYVDGCSTLTPRTALDALKKMLLDTPGPFSRSVHSSQPSRILIGVRSHTLKHDPVYRGDTAYACGLGSHGLALAGGLSQQIVQYFINRIG